MSRLTPDSPILDLWVYATSGSEVPAPFHLFSAITTIAACVADRVGVEKMPGTLLVPNLYTMLVGPSALGKGAAIDFASSLVADLTDVNLFAARLTGSALIDKLGRPIRLPGGRRVPANTKIFVVAEELAMSVHGGPLAIDLLQILTKLYSPPNAPLKERTRTRGELTIVKPCVNLLAGTTQEWMVRAIPPEMIEGGLMSRLLIVDAPYDFSKRIATPTPPTDRAFIVQVIKERLEALTRLSGNFEMTYEAIEMRDKWYMDRPEPTDKRMASWWKREDDLIYKLAMITSLSRGEYPKLDRDHLVAARRLTSDISVWVQRALDYASMTNDTRGTYLVGEAIRRSGSISRSSLTRRMYESGYSGEQVDEFVQALITMRKVQVIPTGPRGGTSYLWLERRRMDQSNGSAAPTPLNREDE